MGKANAETVKEYIEVVGNQQNLERKYEYVSQDCVIHFPPYVGIGGIFKSFTSDPLVFGEILSGAPADGKLLPGDELIRASDERQTWDTLDALKEATWGHGAVGSTVTVTVRRNGELLDIPLIRGLVHARELKFASPMMDSMERENQKTWPDLKSDIHMLLEQGDLVACYMVNNGTNTDYERTAVWSECNIYRVRDQKIVEIWGVSDNQIMMEQLGYKIEMPQKVKAS